MTPRAHTRKTARSAASAAPRDDHATWLGNLRWAGGRQRGSVPIVAFSFVIVVLILALAIDAGYAFMKRRDLQRTADMAALAGAQTLPGCANATSYDTVARANVTANLGADAANTTVATACGIWTNPTASATTPGTFAPVGSGGPASGNAVQVTLTLPVVSFFQLTGTRNITATAIARKAPAVVTFTVDSGLLALNANNSVLAPLLQSIGLTPSVYVGAAQKLVGVNITPQGLLQALGVPVTGDVSVASLSGVAAIQNLTLGQLLSATNTALATQNGALSASVSALGNLINVFGTLPILNLPVKLLGTATSPGIIANIDAAGVTAANALTANIGVADLITAAVVGANGNNAIAINGLSILGNAVTASANVISPPQVGIGGVGATATTAQVRVFLQVNTAAASGALGSLVGGLLSSTGTVLKLPLVLTVAQSTATVTAVQCGASPSTTIQVNSGLVNVCVADPATGVNPQLNPATCTTVPTPIATLLGLITVSGNVNVSLATNSPPPITFTGPFPQKVGPIGTSVDLTQIVNALLTGLSLNVAVAGTSTSGTIGSGLVNNVPASAVTSTISTVNQFLNNAATGLQSTANGLTGALAGVLTLNIPQVLNGVGTLISGLGQTLGGLVSGLVSGLSDTLCNLSILTSPNQCRINAVSGSISTSNISPVLGSILYTLLNPLLTPISTLLNTLLNALGITLGMTTVTVDSINCQNGLVQLVY
ncbi:pilus assembly protein TadG-related protein [Pandoraea sp. PE-S2R-1]|uniref:pilus assembly protein TadG-related protein n=1 Tax=Pandoraea sp. PE-S2R-1 TaxID=1986994 RepID=UPI000B3FA377|nr:pilus assembly protein TadG-related protein [Pandoraea sp. PE-S2R-1]